MQNEGRTNERGFKEGNKRIGGVVVEEEYPEEKRKTRFDLSLRLQVRIKLARRVSVTLRQCAKSQRGTGWSRRSAGAKLQGPAV